MAAVQTQASWSFGMNVNLLASGYNRPLYGSTGSGIYHKNEGALEYYMAEDTGSYLLYANVSQNIQPKNKLKLNTKIHNEKIGLYTSRDKLDNYNYIKLSEIYGVPQAITVCNNKICCDLLFQLNSVTNEFHYHLLAYDGLRTHAGGRYESKLQVCAVVACGSDDLNSCTDGFQNCTYSKYTEFAYIQLRGKHFKTSRVLPNTLLSNTLGPIEHSKLLFQKYPIANSDLFDIHLEHSSIVKNVHTFGIYTHDYEPNSSIRLSVVPFILLLSLFLTRI